MRVFTIVLVLIASSQVWALDDGVYICSSSSMNGPTVRSFMIKNVTIPGLQTTVPYVELQMGGKTIKGFGTLGFEENDRQKEMVERLVSVGNISINDRCKLAQ